MPSLDQDPGGVMHFFLILFQLRKDNARLRPYLYALAMNTLAALLLLTSGAVARGEEDRASSLINYEELTHTIRIVKLRSGNHSESGKNNYFFEVTAYALKIDKAEKKKSFEERLKLQRPMGSFANIKIKTLSSWEVDPQKNSFEIDGDLIRELTSNAMRQFQAEEERIAIKITIAMFAKSKKYYALDNNHLIGSASYTPITDAFPHTTDVTDHTLSITDKFGTEVGFEIKYRINAKKQQEAAQQGEAP
jgi:hypothetical protein